MRRKFGTTPVLLSLLALAAAGCGTDVTQPVLESSTPTAVAANVGTTLSPGVSDGHGTAWRQLTETVGLSPAQVALSCPRDGMTPCAGTGTLAGWVWATDSQVVDLLSRYEPAILTNRVLSGVQYGAAVTAFFADFLPTTTGGCSGSGYIFTCSFGAHASGWTASTSASGFPISGTVQSGFSSLPLMQVVPDGGSASVIRGVFMWRADGTGNTGIIATDDSGTVNSPYVGVVVANVLVNDVFASGPATTDNVTLAQLSTTNAGVSLDVTTGAVRVAYGVRVGVETLRYRICQTGRPSNCDTADVTVTMAGNRVDAVDDMGATKTGGGTAIESVLANDTFAGGAATASNVTLRVVSADPVLSLQADGSVVVAAGASVGVHVLTYEICETVNPGNCDSATATVTVSAYLIDALDDQGSAPSASGGVAVANVLGNDRFDGATATLAKVSLVMLSSTSAGITLDPASGAVRVQAGTPGGVAQLTYRICERASAANCDQATVTVTIVPQGYVVSNERIKVKEGNGGAFSVRLLQQPIANVVVNVSYLAGTMNVTSTVTSLTFTPANWNTAQSLPFSTYRDSGRDDNAGTLQLTAAGIAIKHLVVEGLDTDRKGTFPVTSLQSPYNGQTVSGMVNLSGTATDSDGTLVEGKFALESNRIATATNVGGTFRATWNSATVPNGWYTLELRVTDNGGNDGRMSIKVFISN
jgi:hypothetical protein